MPPTKLGFPDGPHQHQPPGRVVACLLAFADRGLELLAFLVAQPHNLLHYRNLFPVMIIACAVLCQSPTKRCERREM